MVWESSGLPHALRASVGDLGGKEGAAAVLREWSRSVQNDASVWVERLVAAQAPASGDGNGDTAGAAAGGVDWVDPISGCSAVHFAAKSGCDGVGDDDAAAVIMSDLIRKGADTNKACAYAHMTPLHYAAYFGCTAVLAILLRSRSATGQVDVNKVCDTRRNSTALHFAVMGGNVGCVQTLVEANANTELKDDDDRKPIDVARQLLAAPGEFDDTDALKEIVTILEKEGARFVNYTGPRKLPAPATPPPLDSPAHILPHHLGRPLHDEVSDTSSVMGSQIGDEPINVGDRVYVHNKGAGLVRFKDKTKFRPGVWYGVQLDEPVGKNNGTVGYVTYFRTKPKHGVFVRRSRLTKIEASPEKHASPARTPISTAPRRRSSRAPAPFTAPTFRTKGSIRPDHGKAAAMENYTFVHHRESPTSSTHGSQPTSPALSRRSTTHSNIGTPRTDTSTPMARMPSTRGSGTRKKGSSFRSEVPRHLQQQQQAASPKTPAGIDSFGVQSRVLCSGKIGTVTYVGPSHLGEGTYIGVIFSHAPDNGHNGTVDGHTYFKCGAGHGLLVPATRVHWHGRRADKVLKDNR
ncbi:hypothetical protein PTSG_06448 [Salpingoeca rosetta]|uniref:CAP-Gly domain-containing protein n=1 Tax=Salpingoeca rosetta (strain ATCC 50818 / BSB-021) TaxID=946362 RepID=F2UFU3_SALR5|nr:uncharacterized protein PTSG_06448 [Salpingoeca rosetta]EGD75371.1 hypothetical protein PTSG_06448 [Salpingoeca rosetta]|eukprot:XP_004991828.1 hypothetical protein PTSG_06448 [Salpingoeca rosetta]